MELRRYAIAAKGFHRPSLAGNACLVHRATRDELHAMDATPRAVRIPRAHACRVALRTSLSTPMVGSPTAADLARNSMPERVPSSEMAWMLTRRSDLSRSLVFIAAESETVAPYLPRDEGARWGGP